MGSTPGTRAGSRSLATLPPEFRAISRSIWIAPAPAIYALVVGLVLWVVFEFLPLGRYLYVLGASPRAAELNGISAKRYITFAFIAAGMLASFAGDRAAVAASGRAKFGRAVVPFCPLSRRRCSAQPRSARVESMWGTVLAVAVLAVTVAGLNQLGAPFFVEPLFNGSMLILAVGLAVQAAQRRQQRGVLAENAEAAGATAGLLSSNNP